MQTATKPKHFKMSPRPCPLVVSIMSVGRSVSQSDSLSVWKNTFIEGSNNATCLAGRGRLCGTAVFLFSGLLAGHHQGIQRLNQGQQPTMLPVLCLFIYMVDFFELTL